jgi:hypothetical protein
MFVFASPERADKTVLILDMNPSMTGAHFSPNVIVWCSQTRRDRAALARWTAPNPRVIMALATP